MDAQDGVRVLIPAVDTGVEKLLRAALPLRADVGDVSFDAPSGAWSAQLARITVNLYLFAVSRSAQPARPSADRIGPDGRPERRKPLPQVELNYLVSVYAGSTRDEHQLLSDVFTCLATNPVLPAEHVDDVFDATIQLHLAHHEQGRVKDVWTGVGGHLRPSFELVVTAPLDGLPYEALAPRVERIESLTRPMPRLDLGRDH